MPLCLWISYDVIFLYVADYVDLICFLLLAATFVISFQNHDWVKTINQSLGGVLYVWNQFQPMFEWCVLAHSGAKKEAHSAPKMEAHSGTKMEALPYMEAQRWKLNMFFAQSGYRYSNLSRSVVLVFWLFCIWFHNIGTCAFKPFYLSICQQFQTCLFVVAWYSSKYVQQKSGSGQRNGLKWYAKQSQTVQ